MHRSVTVVIPAYGNWELLQACIQSCIDTLDEHDRVLVIDDATPEEGFFPRLQRFAEPYPSIQVLRNSKNIGFVASCNRAVLEEELTDNDILLLNADAALTDGAVREMKECLYSAERHGVCCPRSNDATILTFPSKTSTWDTHISASQRHERWKQVRQHLPRMSLIPTGVGFCMLIKRSLIRRFGLFDPVYGRGYNEENDFCMRIGAMGYSAVMANHAFVFHKGGASFMPKEAQELEERNREILHARYPKYRNITEEYRRWGNGSVEWFGDVLSKRSRKRIAIDMTKLHAAYNGTNEYALHLCQELVPLLERHADVTVLTTAAVDQFLNISQRYQQVLHVDSAGTDTPRFDLAFVPQQLFSRSHLSFLNRIALRYVLTMHDVIALRCANLKEAEAEQVFHDAMRSTDGIVCVSNTSARDIRNYETNIHPRQIVVHHGYIPLSGEAVNPWQELPGLPEQFVLVVGNHFEHKALTQGLKGIPSHYPIVVIGSVSERIPGEQPCFILKSGTISPGLMQGLYESCAAVVFPSQYEGFGLPILHASACGKPILVQDMSITREIAQSFDLHEYVHLFETFDDIAPTLHRALHAKHALLPRKHERSWRDAAEETAEFVRSILEVEINYEHLQSRFAAMVHDELAIAKQVEQRPWKQHRVVATIDRALLPYPSIHRPIKRRWQGLQKRLGMR